VLLLTVFNILKIDYASQTEDGSSTRLPQKKHKYLGCAGRHKKNLSKGDTGSAHADI